MHQVLRVRRVLMHLAAWFALSAVAGLVSLALRVFDTLPAWFGPAIGCLVSLALICVAAAFFISADEPMFTRSGRRIRNGYSPFWHRIDMALTFGLGLIALLFFAFHLL